MSTKIALLISYSDLPLASLPIPAIKTLILVIGPDPMYWRFSLEQKVVWWLNSDVFTYFTYTQYGHIKNGLINNDWCGRILM